VAGSGVSAVQEVVQHELELAPAQGRWMYHARFTQDGIQIDARRIQTNDGLITWVFARNGVPLSASELDAQQNSLERNTSDPSFTEKNRAAMQNDNRQINSLFADLPGGVTFDCLTQSGDVGTVRFKPLQGSCGFSIERCIVAGMSGTIVLDTKNKRLLAASGSEQNDLSMFLGFTRVNKGSSIRIARTEAAPGIWETSTVSVHFKGQLLFLKTITRDTDESRTEYIRVPEDLTAHAAISYLKNPNRLP
jgi:hypothetical protein